MTTLETVAACLGCGDMSTVWGTEDGLFLFETEDGLDYFAT